MPQIDHLILEAEDVDASVRFYVDVLGFTFVGRDGPFTVVRVDEDFVLQLAQRAPKSPQHLAFALEKADFDSAFARIRERGIAYGPSFSKVGTNEGPGRELGARGEGPTLYFYDPSGHLLEIRTYA